MRRTPRFFRQHTNETCGISCILMILHCFGRVQYPTARQERKLYSIYRCRAYCGVLAAAAAECLSKNRLRVGLWHGSAAMMENRDGYFEDGMFAAMQREYREALARAGDLVQVETGCELTPAWLRDQLDQGRLVMLQCIVPGDVDGLHDRVLHWVLCYGHEGGEFLICDPFTRKIRLTEAELTHYMDTPIGRIAVTAADGDAQ